MRLVSITVDPEHDGTRLVTLTASDAVTDVSLSRYVDGDGTVAVRDAFGDGGDLTSVVGNGGVEQRTASGSIGYVANPACVVPQRGAVLVVLERRVGRAYRWGTIRLVRAPRVKHTVTEVGG